jgi:hypothetical protein
MDPRPVTMMRLRHPAIRLSLCAIAVLAAAWAAAVYAWHGFSWSVGSLKLSSSDPLRPMLVSGASAIGYVLASGMSALRRDVAWLWARATPATFGVLLSLLTVVTALRFNAWAAGGADAYGYVTQADLWLQGLLRIEMPLAADAPWPDAIGTLTPFGYRGTPDRRALVPVTAPGLPLLMASVKRVAGHCAMFAVVPLTAGLLVWATFTIGRRLGSDALGLAAAWLIATSPTVLSMSKSVMSDVPAAALWALAISLLLTRSAAAAFAAGASASAALLVRPNLLPIALVLGAWTMWHDFRAGGDRHPRRVIAYAAGVVPGCLAVAFVNQWLYGSPIASGYGALDNLFSFGNVPVNARRYTAWLAQTQTPVALLGAVALFIPSRRLWPTEEARYGALLLALVIIAVFGAYCAYRPFDEWWYLRFLLPSWPPVCLGTAALMLSVLGSLHRRPAAWRRGLAGGAILALGIYGLVTASRLGVYPPGEGERRYATIAELVARVTDPSSVIITTAHVGPMRYYGGRLTVRYDVLDEQWLDRAVDWLEAQGRHPYILLEDWEVREFERRFAAGNVYGRLVMPPVLVYEAYHIGGRVFLFDPRNASAVTWQPTPIRDPRPRCPTPAG